MSTVLAAAVGLLTVLTVGVAAGVALQAGVVIIASLGFAGGTALLVEPDPIQAAAGTVVSVLSACGLVVVVAIQHPVAMAALALGAFGSAAIPFGSLGDDRLTDAAGTLVYALIPIGAFAVVAASIRFFGLIGNASTALYAPTEVGANVAGFSILLLVAAGGCLLALRSLPVVRLAPKRDRDRIRDRYRRADARLKTVTWIGVVLVPVSIFGWAILESNPGLRSMVELPATVTGSPVLRVSLLGVAVLSLVVAVSVRVVRWAGGSVVELTRRGTAAIVGVALSILAVPLAGPVYSAAAESLDPRILVVLQDFGDSIGVLSTVLLAALLAVFLFVAALLALPAAVGIGLAPDRTAASAFAAAGILVGSALVVDQVAPPVVLGGVVAAMVVWDLGEYGVGLTEEIDTEASTRAEAVHAAGSLGVGTVVVAGAVGVHAVVTDVTIQGATALAGLAVAFVGVVLLAAVLRG